MLSQIWKQFGLDVTFEYNFIFSSMKNTTPDFPSLKDESIELREVVRKFLEFTDQKGEWSFSVISRHVQDLSPSQKETSNDLSTVQFVEGIRKIASHIDDVLLSLQRECDINWRNTNIPARLFLLKIGQVRLNINRFIVEIVIELTRKIVSYRISKNSTTITRSTIKED